MGKHNIVLIEYVFNILVCSLEQLLIGYII